MLGLINKVVHSMRVHTEIPGGECHRHENGIQKKDDEIQNFCIKWLFGMDAGSGCTDKPWQFFCSCTVVFLHQNGGADVCDVI